MSWQRTTFNGRPALALCPQRHKHKRGEVCAGPVVEQIDDWPTDDGEVQRFRAWSAMEGVAGARRCLGVRKSLEAAQAVVTRLVA